MTSATADACGGQEDGVPIGASDTIASRVGISDPLPLAFLCQFRQFIACGHTPAVAQHIGGGIVLGFEARQTVGSGVGCLRVTDILRGVPEFSGA